MRKILVLGAGGFIGHHLVFRLKKLGNYVIGADLVPPQFEKTYANEFVIGDLREYSFCETLFNNTIDEVYQLAADMGGANYIFTGEHDYDIMTNSAAINLNVSKQIVKNGIKKVFFSSSACVYPKHNQLDPTTPDCAEHTAYPADPDSEYGWEKLFSERIYLSLAKNYGVDVKIGRYHNVYGTLCAWDGGKEKAPAALCRKVAKAEENGFIEVIGSGKQTRSFLYIDDCLDASIKLMESKLSGPYNIGSEEKVSIDELASIIIKVSKKNLSLVHVNGPVGVAGRTSNNTLINSALGWQHKTDLSTGIQHLYNWITEQCRP